MRQFGILHVGICLELGCWNLIFLNYLADATDNARSELSMKRRWNWNIWAGFLLALAALFTYPFFVLFPVTRDFPWVNLLLFCAGGVLLAVGLARTFRSPEQYRGKICGPIFAGLSLLMFGLFAYGVFYEVRQLPIAAGAPRVGQQAPDFTLPDQDKRPVGLSDLLSENTGTPAVKPNAVLLIFYRGYW